MMGQHARQVTPRPDTYRGQGHHDTRFRIAHPQIRATVNDKHHLDHRTDKPERGKPYHHQVQPLKRQRPCEHILHELHGIQRLVTLFQRLALVRPDRQAR